MSQRLSRDHLRGLWGLAALLACLLVPGLARAQRVQLGVESRQIYAEVPFVLQVTASDFEETPEPEVQPFEIEGAKVSFLGVSPSVMSRTTIINGRRSSFRDVRFVYSYRVEVPQPGRYQIPAISVTQGDKSASSSPSEFRAGDVADTQQMRIEQSVPDRPVWIGESFEVTIDWYLRLNPRDHTFVVPLFEHPGFEVEAPPASAGQETLAFSAGAVDIELPYTSEEVARGGTTYTRFRFKAKATPLEAGRFELEAPRVIAKLQTGTGRDAFGFRSPRYELFKSAGKESSLEVKPLPMNGRPASFANAVGTGFGIDVSTSRSVVSVGEPIELSVTIRGERGLEGLSLPSIVGEGRLPESLFDVIDQGASGEISEDGRSKLFKMVVALKSGAAREIPPIEFGYFDPEAGGFKTVKSQPIALNVGDAAMVGASDVVARAPKNNKGTPSKQSVQVGAFSGDLSPSSPSETMRTVLGLGAIAPLLWGLYLVPLALLLFLFWRGASAQDRGQRSELKQSHDKVLAAIAAAGKEPASESATRLASALRDLAKQSGQDAKAGKELRGKLESLAFDPKRKGAPVDSSLLDEAKELATAWVKKSGASRAQKGAASALIFVLALGAAPGLASAGEVDEARQSYEAALEIAERGQRSKAFAEAARQYQVLVERYGDRPELLADWGNASLGAGELGWAVFAYRRALQLDRGLGRAERNLQWVRGQLPEHLVPVEEESAVDALFFWHSSWSLATRHLVAALSFALAMLLLLPVGSRWRSARRRAAIVPALFFVAALGSALLEPGKGGAAVLVGDGETLYSADSSGAPVTLSTPLPAGLEVRLLQERGSWRQIELADGTVGWVQGGAVAEL